MCVLCGNPAAGNVVHKRFGPPDHWWVLPPLTDFIYFVLQSALGTRYTFDFPFCRSCIQPLVQFTPFVRFVLMRTLQCSVVHHNRS